MFTQSLGEKEMVKISVKNIFSKDNSDDNCILHDQWDKNHSKLLTIQNMFKSEYEKGNSELVKNLRAWTKSHEQQDDINKVVSVAQELRTSFDVEAFVTIGIGGSDLGARTLHRALNSSQHNLLTKEDRGGAPEMYFCGDTFDPHELYDLLFYLKKKGILFNTIFNVISKSGTTPETIASFLIIKKELERALEKEGRNPEEYATYIVATTGLNEKSALYQLNEKQAIPFRAMLPVPDGVGGRFSFASPVGLLSLAVSTNSNKLSIKERIDLAVRGLKDAENSVYKDPFHQENVAFQLALANVMAENIGKHTLVFYPYAKILDVVGAWYTQLSTESLQEEGQGQNVVATCGPTGNHSLLNGLLNGPNDKIILFIKVGSFSKEYDFQVPKNTGIGGDLTALEGRFLGEIQNISQQGTEINFTNNNVLNTTISLPHIDEYTLCRLLYCLEASVAVEGELRNIGKLTYLQNGVEGYKNEVRRILNA